VSDVTDGRIEDGPDPKHRQLRELLLGLVVPGKPIPPERELMVTYGVSRATVRKAIDGLVADGVLSRTQGSGTFGVARRVETRLHLASFSADTRRRGRNPSTVLKTLVLDRPPAEVAAALHLRKGAKAWHLVKVRLADNEPMAHEDGWYPADLLPELDRQDIASGSLYEILAHRYGFAIDEAEQTLWGEVTDTQLARDLAAPVGAPLLVFRRVSTAGGQFIEYVVSRFRGDRYEVHMELKGDAVAE
jgi:GntR family transcriptional regulator